MQRESMVFLFLVFAVFFYSCYINAKSGRNSASPYVSDEHSVKNRETKEDDSHHENHTGNLGK